MNEANTLELIELYRSQVWQITDTIDEQLIHITELQLLVLANKDKRKALLDKMAQAQKSLSKVGATS